MRDGTRLFQVVPVLLTIVAQSPVLWLFFWGDDFSRMFKIANDRWLLSAIEMFGGHMMLGYNSFLIASFKMFGPPSALYFATVLALHCIIVILLYRTLFTLTSSRWNACFFSSLWGINPILKGVLGWFCAVGNVLVMMVIMYVIFDIVRTTRPSYLRVGLWILLVYVAALSFGIGIAVSGTFAVALFLFLQGDERRARFAAMALVLIPATVGSYFALNALNQIVGNSHDLTAFLVFNPAFVRDVLSLYFHVVTHGMASVLTGPVAILADTDLKLRLLHATVLVVFGVFSILYWRRASPKERQIWAALALIVLSIYALIALGRVWDMKFGNNPASVVATTPRFHYPGTAILTILLALMLRWDEARYRIAGAAILVAVTVSSILLTAKTVEHWELREPCRKEYASTVAYIEESVLREPEGSTVYIPNKRLSCLVPHFQPGYYFPHTAAVYIMNYPSDTLHGRKVFFVDDDDSVRAVRKFPPARASHLLKTESEARAR